jgi:transcriptional regulator with XRE-family HTH domain
MNKKNPNKESKLKIGENIRIWRDIKQIKQEELAQKIGVSTATMSNIENDGEDEIKVSRLKDIANALEIELTQLFVNPQQLFTFNNSPNSNGVYGTQHQHNFDKSIVERMMDVMEKMTAFFTSKKP